MVFFMNEEPRAGLLRLVSATRRPSATAGTRLMAAADGENLAAAAAITDVGWPGKSLLGEDGAQAAWLLAQHTGGAALCYPPVREGEP